MFARTAASSVRGWTSLRCQTIALVTMAPATMRIPRIRPANLRATGLCSGADAAGSGITSCPVKREPHHHGQQDPETRVHDQQRTQVRLEAQAGEELTEHRGEHAAHGHADDPGREE